jgi:phytoene dehydrogenase-like protein
MHTDYDAIIVGSGPNGLAAAITLQQRGLSVLLLEGKDTIGGGMRSASFTLPGFVHDVCSAVHPMLAMSPFFQQLELDKYGLECIQPSLPAAHPFDDGHAACLHRSLTATASGLDVDTTAYFRLFERLERNWSSIAADVLGPLHLPANPAEMMRFGWTALRSSLSVADEFKSREAKGLWAGMAAHGMQPLSNAATAATAMVLMLAGHLYGWPVVKGGSQNIAQAMAACFLALGGKIETGFYVKSLEQLPSARAILFDITPRQLLAIAGHKFSTLYRWQLERYRYGMGVFKIDWALDDPAPFANAACRLAGTVHLGNTMQEIAVAEQKVWDGRHPDQPFVLFSQPSKFDTTRAPAGKHTAWAYCHVPKGSLKDMTEEIERQVERFAPGFRERILGRHVMNTADMEAYNPNYNGGDINGGVMDLTQLFTRPALRASPYRTSAKGLYLCSSSTPPGGGVHGLCGYHAAKRALKDIFLLH